LYYKAKGNSEEDLQIMKEMDMEHMEHPGEGVIGLTDWLRFQGHKIGRRHVRRLMRFLGLSAIYPQKSFSRLGQSSYVKPYLLRNMNIDHANQVWSIDLTYVPMRKGFMYLTAIIDVYSRYIVGWGLHNSLDSSNCIEVLQSAVEKYGSPEIINSDQGSQFTCRDWAEACRASGITMSMDGCRRCLDNIWIERFWRTIKRNYIYLSPEENGHDLYRGIMRFMDKYNYMRPHQGIAHRTPFHVYSAAIA